MFVLCMLRECVQEFNIIVQVCMDCVVQLLKSCFNLNNSHHQQNNVSAHGICILMHACTLYHCYMFLVLTSMILCTESGSETVQKIHRCILWCNCLCVVLIAALYACVAYRRARDDPAAAAGARRRCVSACVSQWRFVKWSDGYATQCQCKTPQRNAP